MISEEESDRPFPTVPTAAIPIAPAVRIPIVAIKKAYQLFDEGRMIDAIPLFQKEIEQTLSQNIEIEGLGNYGLANGYY